MNDDTVRVAISTQTKQDIDESWGLGNGLPEPIDPRSPRWEHGKRLTHIRLTRAEATNLKGYLGKRLALYESMSADERADEPGLIPRYRRDVARISGV